MGSKGLTQTTGRSHAPANEAHTTKWRRRSVLASLIAGATVAASPRQSFALSADILGARSIAEFGGAPGLGSNQSSSFQSAIDASSATREPVFVPPGQYLVSGLSLRPGAHLIGVSGKTILIFAGGEAMVRGAGANDVRLEDLTFTGNNQPVGPEEGAMIDLLASRSILVRGCEIYNAHRTALALREVSGTISACRIETVGDVGIRSLDAAGLTLTDNDITNCGNAGIQIWRTTEGPDGTQVTRNRISRIASVSGGTGQNGNGVNVFRADNVQVSDNRISDVAFSSVRGNAASNLQIIGNQCARHGETALYSEFGFQGAVIANNVVEDAAIGISIANLIDDGRLATCTGNLIRNLKKDVPYEADPFGFGTGIACEGDTTVTGNVVENAPGFGLAIGWGPYLKNVTATGNVVRSANGGVYLSVVDGTGPAVISDNIFSDILAGVVIGYRWTERATDDLLNPQSASIPWLSLSGNQVS